MEAGLTATSYISSMVSPYYRWCQDMGYPELDVKTWADGEWALIEYLNAPIVPSLTKWNYVLTGMRNIPITYGFIKNYADQLALDKKHFWEREAELTRAQDERHKQDLLHSDRQVAEMHRVIKGNDALMQRVARNGLGELSLGKIRRNIPKYRL